MELTRRAMVGGAAAAVIGRTVPGCTTPVPVRITRPVVVGPGAWCWFQSPRAAVLGDSLWLGSTQGTGAPRPGSVDVTCVRLRDLEVLERRSLAVDRVDDHTSPSVLATAGGLQVGWAAHRRLDWLEVGPVEGPLQRIVRPRAVAEPGRGTSYVSAHVVGGRRWILYRGESFSWNLLTSPDGQRWTPHGLVVAPPAGGHRPYVHAVSDGLRLHLLATDGNPSEQRGTSVVAGTVHADLQITDATGRPCGRVGSAPPLPSTLTTVFAGEPGAREELDVDAWMCSLRLVDGRPVAVLSVREPHPPASDPTGAPRVGRWQHRYLWARQRADRSWAVSHLAWAGSELYAGQPDYTGLASLDPTDAAHVVISTDVDPSTASPLVSERDGAVHHELFEGHRSGGTWSWSPLTTNSIEDNLRPLVVAAGTRRLVAWMRGTYRHWTSFDTQLVVRDL